jgi:biotin-dependent carboxylase-like uncharacterized protein
MDQPVIEVLRSGLLTTVQDLGRPGYAHLGVARSGALDTPALVAANRLVGNPDGAAGLEATLTGVVLRTEVATTVAVTGAPAEITVDGAAAPFGAAFGVPAGCVIGVGRAAAGVRTYVGFAGGVSVAPVLGSRSTDTLSGLGPPPLRPGFVLPLGLSSPASAEAGPRTGSGLPGPDAAPEVAPDDGITLRLRLGPRHDWFSVTARDTLLSEPYTLTVKSNRVGARLAGPILSRAVAGELASEGIVLGAVQVPADGQPLVFLADHPTTGGYPVIGVVEPDDLVLLAQARPGTAVRFAAVPPR